MTSVIGRDRRVRVVWALADGAVWVFAVLFAMWLRYLFSTREVFTWTSLIAALVAASVHVGIGFLVGPYRRGHIRGSFDEVVDLALTAAATAALVLAWALASRPGIAIPRTVPVIAATTAATLMMALRFVVRAARRRRNLRQERSERVIVFGAGSGGRLLVRNLVADQSSPYLPVAVLDDDPRLRNRVLDGVKVRGGREAIAKVAESSMAEMLVIAIPSAEPQVLREISDIATEAGLRTMVVPPLHTLVGQQPTARDIRDIHLEDLLGRRQAKLDEVAISNELTSRRVLITGAGGSIGSELARQIWRYGPSELVLLDRDESALHAVQLDLKGNGLLEEDTIVLADIRDEAALQKVFDDHRPQVVFHAAALKHLPLLERYPLEAWKSNVLGTRNVLRAAEAHDVETFVNVSTDKAADPTCVLGYSKRVAERLTADTAQRASGRYMSVRFGNVLGSRGSVIPAFTAQIRRGGPVTVTHPDVERYFMLIPEASQLVMQAAAIGRPGEVMVLDMGEPVKILDVARTLIRMSGRHDIEVAFTGLRPGEKMSEDLFSGRDAARRTEHPLVSSVDVPSLPEEALPDVEVEPELAVRTMKEEALYRPGVASLDARRDRGEERASRVS